MVDQWVIDDEFDAEETAEHMQFFPNTWSDDPISKIETVGAGVFW